MKTSRSRYTSLRASSLPRPLSTLLLDHPSPNNNNNNNNIGSSTFPSFSTNLPRIPSSIYTTDEEHEDRKLSKSASSLHSEASSSSRGSGLVKKLKKAFRVGSGKGKSKSIDNLLPTRFTTLPGLPRTSDPCLSVNQPIQDKDIAGTLHPPSPIISHGVVVPSQDTFLERLRSANTAYLEHANAKVDAKNIGRSDKLFFQPSSSSIGEPDLTEPIFSGTSPTPSGIQPNNTSTNPPRVHGESQNPEGNGNGSRGMSFYCDQALEKCPNRKIIYRLLDDFHCVIDKSFGENDCLQTQCGSLGSEVEQLNAEIRRLKALIDELERRIAELMQENQELRFRLEEQCQLRGDLENIVAQLKEQIARQDELIASLTAEKMDLIACVRSLELELQKLKNELLDIQNENDDLSRGLKGYEESKRKFEELQKALAECCGRCDILQKENYGLRQDIRDIEGKLDTAYFEKNKAISELECLKQQFQEEKDALEAQLCPLIAESATYKQQKADMCKKLNEAISAHHDELDRLKNESDMYREQLEREKREKEDLARRFREGESRKASTSSMLATGQGAELRRQLSQANERAQKYQDMYDREASERKQLERQLRNTEIDNYDLKARANASEVRAGRSPAPPERRRSRMDSNYF